MRNLVCLNRGRVSATSQTAPDLPLCSALFDTVNDSLTLCLGPGEYGVYEVQQFTRTGQTKVLASFPHEESALLSFAHFGDSQQLIFVFSNGDLITAVYDAYGDSESVVEVVGSIDCGISAAKWSDDEETLVLVTEERNVVLLSRDFDSIAEVKLTEEDSRLSNHVDVGWGSKETQFRGKGAKQLERQMIKDLDLERDLNKRDPTMPTYVPLGELTEFDSSHIEIAWRKDCEAFAISTIDTIQEHTRRMIRVFNREGTLESVSEPVDWLENQLAWGPLITSIQRNTHPHIEDEFDDAEPSLDVVFFERNGLRHGEFSSRIPLDTIIDSIVWNSNNEALALLSRDKVYIWTSKNYHWYLKQELNFSANSVQLIRWHPEKPLTLLVGTHTGLEIIDFAHKTTTGPTVAPFDIGMNLVIDGDSLNITPMAIANVPPPMAYRELDVDLGNILDAAVSRSNEHYAVLTNEAVVIATVDIGEIRTGASPEVVATVHKSEFATEGECLRQVAFSNDDTVGVLLDSEAGISRIVVLDVSLISEPYVKAVIDTPLKAILMKSSSDWSSIIVEVINGSVYALDKNFVEEIQDEEYTLVKLTDFPQLCCDYQLVTVHTGEQEDEYEVDSPWATKQKSKTTFAFGITSNGKLFCNDTQIASAITSLLVTEQHLIITTAQHTMRFIHLNTTEFKPITESTDVTSDERIRAVERGSLLVNVMPSKAAVILQAPRGNLETVNPRIMVLGEVRKHISEKQYRDAFLLCRIHRIDLDILHDYNPDMFFANIELIVQQIEKIDYLDLFVSCLHEEDVTKTKYRETNSDAELDELVKDLKISQGVKKNDKAITQESKINKICEAILKVLLTPAYKTKYLQTIITAYACEKPANLEAALRLISSLDDNTQSEKSVVHLCFLQDVNLLYKTALGIYDVRLTLAIAQQSQMDPKEYLPFLQHLHELPELRRQFEIDTHLKKHEKALSHLAEIHRGDKTLPQELLDYVVDYELYQTALGIFKYDNEKQNTILELYARNLQSRQSYSEAGITYELLGQLDDALEAYILGQRWREALSITSRADFKELGEETADRLVAALTEAHKYADAAEVQHRRGYIFDAVSLYCRAYFYADAILLCQYQNKSELVEEVVDPALGDGFGTVAELLADCKGQLSSQLRRLRELREKKAEDPYAFFSQGDQDNDMADNVSVAPSETSTKESFFTRYTGKTGGTAKTGATRKTHKNKRREERKKARGKKGTIYEEEYLVQSVGRMIDRLEQTKPEALNLIEGLLRRGKREQAYQIQKNFVDLVSELKENIVEIYSISEKDRERINEDGEVYYVPEIPVPTVPDFPKLAVLDY
ncbi:CYFA0S02e04588g1_1 [Cyberlindnera fabianii]|uniref:Elongator complex protein 1 n=1 Tax=Cyberlindnera fabianii TaxID=36022 RepID=A0A061AVC1_CYBFA|nr:Elongator complex protein 1 [Cyberlindnera fabianii]CDR38690.1 CYFA0S02e04588g1_1 [Cyberlindnera fabianii]